MTTRITLLRLGHLGTSAVLLALTLTAATAVAGCDATAKSADHIEPGSLLDERRQAQTTGVRHLEANAGLGPALPPAEPKPATKPAPTAQPRSTTPPGDAAQPKAATQPKAAAQPAQHAEDEQFVACVAISWPEAAMQPSQSASPTNAPPKSDPKSTTPAKPATPAKSADPPKSADPTRELLNEGDEVDGNVGEERLTRRARAVAEQAAQQAAQKAKDGAKQAAPAAGEQRPEWAVLLISFTEVDHQANAAAARNAIAQQFPELKTAYVRTLGSGSAVLIGTFTGPQDPAAQAELRRVKEVGQGNPKPFVRAMLTRLVAANSGPIGPNDLRIVRQARPRGTLYTLQVAAWATLGSTEMPMTQVKKSAEAYAQQLRTQGYEAYYFHDFGKETSTVTIGVFGPDAYDSRSTLYDPEVEALMRKFPKSLVNGEEVLVDVDPRKPGTVRIPQSSRLVEIPKM